jgi:phenylpropionate dioxygenase-like ring-hydroxylating dioxygenase large terminal subunit
VRKLFLFFVLAALAATSSAAVVDRIAAVIDRQVLTVSEVSQMVQLRFFARPANQSDDDYRRAVLDNLVAQALRFRDVERFGAEDIPKDSIEARVQEIARRFASPADFDAAVAHAELTPDELRALVKRQLQVEAYIQERFSPLIYIANDDIETYYRGPWTAQRRERGLALPPLEQVREEIRSLLKSTKLQEEIEQWTTQLRARANVDIYAWR